METTTKLNEVADNPRSRRALLAGVVGGLGAWLVSAAQRAMPAEAAAGDPVLAGRTNSGGGLSTELRANTTKPTLRAVQLGGGNALRAEAKNGRAVVGTASFQGTGVWAYSPDHFGVFATSDTGTAVYGKTDHGVALVGDANPNFEDAAALVANGRSILRGHTTLSGDVAISAGLGSATLTWYGSGIPPAPALGQGLAVLFVHQVAGKAQLAVRFPTGAVQVIATEP
jgi:hypothetical protein